MKYLLISITALFILTSCNNNNNDQKISSKDTAVVEKPSFFPVTSYIKGQLHNIGTKGVNPLKYTIVNGHTDSVWLKLEELNENVKDFLTPEIDSVNLTALFTETKFVDRSLEDAFTFTYDPTGKLPDTMQLKHWDVYINGQTGNVSRVYMVKDIAANKRLQLTWVNDKYCKIVTIDNDPGGTAHVEKEEQIKWDF